MKPKAFKEIDLGYIELELYDNYVISTIQEGVAFDFPHLAKIFEIFEDYYQEKPFVSIANREYDYTINPLCYITTPKKSNLLAIAVVCTSKSGYETALFEKQFYKNEYKPFYTIEEAVEWSKELIENYNKKAGL